MLNENENFLEMLAYSRLIDEASHSLLDFAWPFLTPKASQRKECSSCREASGMGAHVLLCLAWAGRSPSRSMHSWKARLPTSAATSSKDCHCCMSKEVTIWGTVSKTNRRNLCPLIILHPLFEKYAQFWILIWYDLTQSTLRSLFSLFWYYNKSANCH